MKLAKKLINVLFYYKNMVCSLVEDFTYPRWWHKCIPLLNQKEHVFFIIFILIFFGFFFFFKIKGLDIFLLKYSLLNK